jgi:transposase-like protein
METSSFTKTGGNNGEIEFGETFIGSKARNRHSAKRKLRVVAQVDKGKAIVFGILERDGEARTQVIEYRKDKTLQPIIREQMKSGTEVYTDMHLGYWGLNADYVHQIVEYARG